ncbi:MAG: uridine diphosphate-N-acetylglucosamine-binding protein YvcK [Frankia sp.]|nr:uridine diphosphate-N-acetylglucosamine-binding protein YvcK [Frankia sp.]
MTEPADTARTGAAPARPVAPARPGGPAEPGELAGPDVVAFGGGHGLAASLAALRRITDRLTAVVTVGDDGGSSGRLRAELGALPPGDLRMALAALAGADPWSSTWAEVFQRRFGGDGPLSGHAVGNLVLTALAEHTGSVVAALELAGRLLGVRGRVLPLSEESIDIVAEVAGLDPDDPTATREVRGQVAVATTRGAVISTRVEPAEPRACPSACAAVETADWLVLGPGSLYTSMLPHLLVPQLHKTIMTAPARRLVVLNLVAQPGETEGYTPEAHLRVLARHAPDLTIDVVLADPTAVPDAAALAGAAADLGARLHLAPVRSATAAGVHDPRLLAAAFDEVFSSFPAGQPAVPTARDGFPTFPDSEPGPWSGGGPAGRGGPAGGAGHPDQRVAAREVKE